MSLSATLLLPHDDLSWLAGGGEMGALIRAMDWSATPLGPLARWPQSLRTSVSLCLSSTFPILVAWGPEHIQIYNDAYRPICGAKHPASMGEPFKVCWATALPVVGEAFDSASRGQGAYIHNQRMTLDRYGYLEEAFMTFSFSPIRDESGGVGGIFHPITESTAQVLAARRTQSLRDLSGNLAGARSIADIGAQLSVQSTDLALDLPFLLFYQCAENGALDLLGSAGLAEPALQRAAQATLGNAPWPLQQAARARRIEQIDGIAAWFDGAPCGPYARAPDSAMVLPVSLPGQQDVFGFVVAGVSSHRPLELDYRSFYERLNAVVETAVGNVLAWEQEQRRAAALEKLDRAKTAFFSNVSHEFRTPLTLILGPLDDALADGAEALPASQRARLELTRRNALRLLKLVNSLLDFSRIEAGRVQARYVALDLAALTGELASVFESAMAKGGLAYHVEIDRLDEPVYIDRDMWEKIVFNLLSNAFKFTLEGSVTLRLQRHGSGVRLSVIDTGSGIPQAELGRVFERFHRIEGTPGRTYEGTGIGLALIQELVELHGGGIGVTSTLGAGSRFDVDLPFGHAHLPPERIGAVVVADMVADMLADMVADSEQRTGAAFVEEALRWLPDAPASLAGLASPAVSAASAPGRTRILVADDNNDMRAYVQALLAPHYAVQGCADGEAAFALALADPPDLLLSDVMMPRLDGFGLVARLRATPALHDLPVILLSARAGEEARIEGLQAGADDYLAKPFAAAELLARVRHQVARAGARQRESTFRALVDAAPVMLWRIDDAGMTTYLSARWYDYTGRSPEQDLGLGWLENVHPDDLAEVGARFQSARAARQPFSLDYRLRGRDGAYRWVIDAGHPHTDAQGGSDGFVGTVIDVHDRALLQDRFEQVARALLEKNRLQSEFLITLAHELRNPLAPIRTGLELIDMRPDGSDNRTIHAMMQRQVNHMAHLVDDLLDVARLTEGKVTLQRASLLLADVVRDALEMSAPQVAAGAHGLTVDLPQEALWLDADRHRIAQVLSNLVNNAAKYTPKRGRIVVGAVRQSRTRDGQDCAGVAVSVSDNGIGIARDLLAHVFDMYTQVHDSAPMAQGGLGVGLHLVQRLVQLHGGAVAAASAGAGQGSCFTVWLPLAAGHAAQSPGHGLSAVISTGSAASSGLDVLVVDDNLDAASMLGELLQASGHRVRLAHDGAAALASAALHTPAVVFLDIGLPDMSGLDVAVALRRLPGLGTVTLVALTGWGTQEDRARTLQAGFDLHLTKPAQFDDVATLLRAVQARVPG